MTPKIVPLKHSTFPGVNNKKCNFHFSTFDLNKFKTKFLLQIFFLYYIYCFFAHFETTEKTFTNVPNNNILGTKTLNKPNINIK